MGSLKFDGKKLAEGEPAFYRTTFNLDKVGDTFLDMQDGWKKGVVWVNGRNLGRYWEIGAQQTLYCPAPFMKKGENEIVIFEVDGGFGTVSGVLEPVWKVNPEVLAVKLRKPGETVTTEGLKPVHKASFKDGKDTQIIKFDAPAEGRYIGIEAYNAHDGKNHAAIAELLFMDEKGAIIPRENYQVVYADSEEIIAEDGSAGMVMDNQPTTQWHTQWQDESPGYPHLIIIDLGKDRKVSGFNYIPRQDMGNGRIKDYAVFMSGKPFPGKK